MTARLLAVLCCALTSLAMAQTQQGWQPIGEDKWVLVSAERVLYESKDAPPHGFSVHVRIHKKIRGALAFSKSKQGGYVCPNQWSFYSKPLRDLVDEETLTLRPVDTQAILSEYRDHEMQLLGDDLDYYAYFNGKAPDKPDFEQARYLLISMHGRLVFSDGKTVDTLFVNIPTDLAIPLPIQWKPLPANANEWLAQSK